MKSDIYEALKVMLFSCKCTMILFAMMEEQGEQIFIAVQSY